MNFALQTKGYLSDKYTVPKDFIVGFDMPSLTDASKFTGFNIPSLRDFIVGDISGY